MTRIITAFVIFCISICLTGCTKEQQLERTLYKAEAGWKVKSADWQQVSQSSSSGQSIVIGTSADAGSFQFDKDGGGSYTMTLGTETYTQTFTWTVSDSEFSIVKVSQSIDFMTGDVVQIAVAFSGTRQDKNTLNLEGSETLQYVSGDIDQKVMTGTFVLVRE